MKDFIEYAIENLKFSDNMVEILKMIREYGFDPMPIRSFLNSKKLSISDIKDESLGLLVDYARFCLEDNHLSEIEMNNVRMLKLILKVREGDFLKHGKENCIKEILGYQLKRMFEDNEIDYKESLEKVSLQEFFGLSYDQYLSFEHKIVENAISNGADIHKLDTFIKL